MIRTIACAVWYGAEHDATSSTVKEYHDVSTILDDGMAHVRTAFLTTEQHWTGDLQTAFVLLHGTGEEAKPHNRSRRTTYNFLTARHFRSHGLGPVLGIRGTLVIAGRMQ